MTKRKFTFENGEFYHIYNRGVDKRNIIMDENDIYRILESLDVFNTTQNVGSIHENSFEKRDDNQLGNPVSKLVGIVAFNILDNHYHLVLKQISNNGISKFIKSFAGGYTKYFNEKYERSGVLFQGPFKAEHINSEAYLRYVIDYVNLNHFIHGLEKLDILKSDWGERSSLEQYIISNKNIWRNKHFKCDTSFICNECKKLKGYEKDLLKMAKMFKENKKAKKDFEYVAGPPISGGYIPVVINIFIFLYFNLETRFPSI
ncbi:transposase [Patescibacteria group bacterium]|nr:transposase [Patescibacteria group bacterium]